MKHMFAIWYSVLQKSIYSTGTLKLDPHCVTSDEIQQGDLFEFKLEKSETTNFINFWLNGRLLGTVQFEINDDQGYYLAVHLGSAG